MKIGDNYGVSTCIRRPFLYFSCSSYSIVEMKRGALFPSRSSAFAILARKRGQPLLPAVL
jgi:hypothetical protein